MGFALAGYTAIANDSIQTVGTFIASNQKRPWWLLWLYIGGIFIVTVAYSWLAYDGDVSYHRLPAKGFAEAPTEFTFLQIAAPLFLLVLTRLRMPVSTTFLLLSCFSADLVGFVFAGLGILFYLKGDRIQRVVTEKTEVTDIRSATLIDFVYALLLYGFVTLSVIPMSTTWVFIGLLGGREIALSLAACDPGNHSLRKSWQLMRKDLAYAGIELAVSIILAIAAQPNLRRAMWSTLL